MKKYSENDNEHFQNRPISLNSRNNLLEIEEHMYILEDVENYSKCVIV